MPWYSMHASRGGFGPGATGAVAPGVAQLAHVRIEAILSEFGIDRRLAPGFTYKASAH